MTLVSRAQVALPGDSVRVNACSDRLNYIQFFNKEVLRSFVNKWSGEERIVIALFGDSHVQPGIYPGEMRNQLQAVRGFGGFGMTFPYAAAKTYSDIHYTSSCKGVWIYSKSLEYKPKLSLGVSGVTAKTADPHASIKLNFRKSQPKDYAKLRIYCRQDDKSFDFIIKSAGNEVMIKVDSADHNPIEVVMEKMDSSLELRLVKQGINQTDFELYGISLESTVPGGLILHSLGVGGARYGSILEEKLFDIQLPTLKPDLVILDFGTNDYLYDNTLPADLEAQVVKVIGKVRATVPGATIMLTSAQDMYWKNMPVTAGVKFSDLIRKVARNQHCLFYDWYWISGGPGNMSRWVEGGLAKKDMIHLTLQGYVLKGQRMAEALLRSIKWVGSNTSADSLVFNVDSLKRLHHLSADTLGIDSIRAIPGLAVKTEVTVVRHKIAKGETLKSIAKRYHVKADEIRKANGLKNSRIIEGDYLNIELKEGRLKEDQGKQVKPNSGNESTDKYLMHKVKEGETLSELAEKYRVTITQIKKLNRLKTTRIRTGQNLKIKLKTVSSDSL